MTDDSHVRSILITGATDGIGLEAAKRLAAAGHRLTLHGRNPAKLDAAVAAVTEAGSDADVTTVIADLSDLDAVRRLATDLTAGPTLDVVINNAGIFETDRPETADGLDVRFVVNTIAPYLLTTLLLPHLAADGRVVNLSSAAQQPVDLDAMVGPPATSSIGAYAQSKLALTMWNHELARRNPDGPAMIAVNPGSYLATKMVQEGFGVEGNDIGIGADILVRAAVDDGFSSASGEYWDNDAGGFGAPHPDALDPEKNGAVVARLDAFVGATGDAG